MLRVFCNKRICILFFLIITLFWNGQAMANSEQDFWNWFVKNDAALFDFEQNQEKVFTELTTAMQKVQPNLTFEFGPKENGRREFVISADGIKDAFPAVEHLFQSAPKLPHWTFIKFRPRRTPMNIRYQGVTVEVDRVTARLVPEGTQIGVVLFFPDYTPTVHKTYHSIAFLLLDQALGEYDVEMRVGTLQVAKPSTDAQSLPLQKLTTAFDAMAVTMPHN
jgi:hypothetical protein